MPPPPPPQQAEATDLDVQALEDSDSSSGGEEGRSPLGLLRDGYEGLPPLSNMHPNDTSILR